MAVPDNERFFEEQPPLEPSKTLQQEFEDALIGAAVNDQLFQLGKALLEQNEALRNDPSFQLPKGMNKRVMRNLRRAERRMRHGTFEFPVIRGRTRKALARVAMLLVVIGIAGGVFVKYDAIRMTILNTFMEVGEDSTRITLVDGNEKLPVKIEVTSGYMLTGLSNDYEIESFVEEGGVRKIKYRSKSDKNITIVFTVSPKGIALYQNTEKAAQSKKCEVNGKPALICDQSDTYLLSWVDEDKKEYFYVQSNLDKESIIAIGESAKYVQMDEK